MTRTTTKTKTQTKCLKNSTFLKSWWLTHSKYDDGYLTLVMLFTPVILVTLFQSYNRFYRAECISVSGFFLIKMIYWFLFRIWLKISFFKMRREILPFNLGLSDKNNFFQNQAGSRKDSRDQEFLLRSVIDYRNVTDIKHILMTWWLSNGNVMSIEQSAWMT